MRHVRAIAGIVLWGVLAGTAAADETARQILDRRKALDDTTRKWSDRSEKMKLTIADRRGSERVRELAVFDLKLPGDEQKTILFFESPADVKGTGFLAFTHKGKPADQWLFLPELKRVRQITARARSESFVGTDLSYRDLDIIQEMANWTEADATSNLRGEETVDGTATYIIELMPQREDIGYKKIVLWLAKDDLTPRRLDLFENGAEASKRIDMGEVRAVGVIPVAHRIQVSTLSTGSRTEIGVSDVKFNQGLKEGVFSQRYLEQGRID